MESDWARGVVFCSGASPRTSPSAWWPLFLVANFFRTSPSRCAENDAKSDHQGSILDNFGGYFLQKIGCPGELGGHFFRTSHRYAPAPIRERSLRTQVEEKQLKEARVEKGALSNRCMTFTHTKNIFSFQSPEMRLLPLALFL